MPASSGLPGLVNLTDYEAAHRHTDHIWDETLYKRRMKVYPVLAGQIYRQLQHFLTDQTDQLSARQKAGLDPEGWMTLHLKQMREMQAEMKVGCMNVLLSVWQWLQLPSNGTNPKLEPDGEGV
jgi:hypothetical protein